ncbi:hypothetical protein [Altererythrobacter sp. ZODW24]|uniref:hypothetical protein n=1 Tax=Altererythrobacter sp. ZODW24 TaxID=2185142 RepID=UPI000DF7523E|nr:hypothetical protein [Altererythrobacter sp. ZODW24]
MSALTQRIEKQLDAPVDDAVRTFAEALGSEVGALGVLFYGSNLRTGSLEGVLDFYVLLDGPREGGIWPRVSYHERDHDGETLRAKVATMTLATFHAAAAGNLTDTTIWARFVQPSGLAWGGDKEARSKIVTAIAQAAQTAARLAVALGPKEGREEDYWRALFQATYAAEFRVEKSGRENSILEMNSAHFDGLLPAALAAQSIPYERDGNTLRPQLDDKERFEVKRWWAHRQRLGKPLNFMRLLKASTTFEGAARYGAWKIERHTGVPVKLTPWREKHPVLAAPGVLFDVWRKKRAGS